MGTCKNCNSILKEGDVYCSECGEKHIERNEIKYCSKCGININENENFCSNCGVKNQNNDNQEVKYEFNAKINDVIINPINEVSHEKIEAVEYAIKVYNKEYSHLLIFSIILTIASFLVLSPILIIVMIIKRKRKKKINKIREMISNDKSIYNRIRAASGFNSVSIDINGISIEIPQGYIWFSDYSKKSLCSAINN